MSPDKFKEFEKLVTPLYEWLQDNYNPHTSIIIECGFAKIVQDTMGIPLGVRDLKG